MVKKLLSVSNFVKARNWRCALRRQILTGICVLISYFAHGQSSLFADINKSGSLSIDGVISQLTSGPSGLVFFVYDNNVWRSDGTSLGTYKLLDNISVSNIRQLTSCGDRIYFVAHYYDDDYLFVSYGGYATVCIFGSGEVAYPRAPDNLYNANGILYFSATDATYGREAWKAYGDYNDMERVTDIMRGSGSSNPTEFENVNGTIYFAANDGTNGYELWKTNGTAAGTALVKDVRAGSKLSSTPKQLTNVNGTLYFSAYDETRGRELWKSNGTAAGTVLVKDIRPGTGESIPDNLTAVGTTIYFGANDGTTGRELWKSNGTTSGTVLVKDITPGAGSNAGGGYPHLSSFIVFNGKLYLMAYTDRPRIWRSDGTAAGTTAISPLDRHFVGINSNLTVFNGAIYYVANDNVDPERGTMEMWKTDGTLANHQHIRSNLGVWQNTDMELTPTGPRMFFTTWELYSGEDEALWLTDGTAAGTQEVIVDQNTGSSTPAYLTTMGSAIYFSATNGTQYGLFKTDGTVAGTGLLKEIPRTIKDFYTANGILYFIQSETGSETLWRSDGTVAGTYALKMLMTNGSENRIYRYDVISNGIVFVTFDNVLWRTDGTVAGTYQLKSFPYNIGWIANSGEEVMFAANDGVRGLELWRSNGTVSGTVLHRDIYSGSASSLLPDDYSEPNIDAAVTLNNVVYFLANAGGDTNFELWRTDGTGGTGTRMVKNDETGKPFNPANGIAAANNSVFLFTYEGRQGDTYIEKRTLWKSDGTTLGTLPIYEHFHDEGLGMMSMRVMGGGANLYFLTTVYLEPGTLYASDGTTEGTGVIYQFGDMESAGPMHLAYDGVKTYIASGHMYDKFMLRSDGTACGTAPITAPAESYSVGIKDYWMAVLDHNLYFPAETEEYGDELYRYVDSGYAPCATATVARDETSAGFDKVDDFALAAHPNPFASTFSVRLDGDDDANYSIAVTGLDGVTIEEHHDLERNKTYDFGSQWRPGLYILKINTGNAIAMRRIIKNE